MDDRTGHRGLSRHARAPGASSAPLLDGVLDTIPQAILLIDPRSHEILGANAAAADLFDCGRADLVGRDSLTVWREADHERILSTNEAFASGAVAAHDAEKVFIRPDGTTFKARFVARVVDGAAGTVVVGRIDKARARQAAAVTSAPDTVADWQTAYEAARRAATDHPGTSAFTVATIGVASVERTMERLGWAAGRSLSRAVLARVQAACRAPDIAMELHGATIALLLHDIGSAEFAISVVRRLVGLFEHPIFVDGVAERVDVQAGVVCITDPSVDSDAALTMAVAALNVARQANVPVSLFDPAAVRHRRGESILDEKICIAIESSEVRAALQPIVDLETGRPVAIEALGRLHIGAVGAISPERFVPLASSRGLSNRITEQVLAHAFDAAHRLGPDAGDVEIGFNVSGEQLVAGFPDWLDQQRPDRVARSRVMVEVTEAVLIERGEALDVLHDLVDRGYRIAIDDFGTGYSSFTYLSQWPAHCLKLEKSFIGPIDSGDQRTITIVRSVLDLANDLGLVTVAEGVERPEQLELLRSWGCNRVQGYLLARPVWPDQLEAVFTSLRGPLPHGSQTADARVSDLPDRVGMAGARTNHGDTR